MFSFFKKEKPKKEKNENQTKIQNEDETFSMKIVLLGSGGKTSLIHRFTEDKFYSETESPPSKKIFNLKKYRCPILQKGNYY